MGFIGTSVNGLVVTRNFNFDPQSRPYANAITADGQLIIGSAVFPNLRSGTLGSSDGSITWTVGAGTITGQVTGGTSVLKTLTPDSGGVQLPTAGNINILGVGSVTTVGSGSTITTQLTGLTNHSVLVGAGTSTITKLAVGTNGQVLIGATAADPAFATITSIGGTIAFTLGPNTLNMEVNGGGFTWTDVTGATQTLAIENGYLTDRSGGVTYTLPATASIGNEIIIVGKAGLATITPNANQQILIGSASGAVGVTGTAVSTNAGDCMTLICTTSGASTVWRGAFWTGNWALTT